MCTTHCVALAVSNLRLVLELATLSMCTRRYVYTVLVLEMLSECVCVQLLCHDIFLASNPAALEFEARHLECSCMYLLTPP